MLTFERATEVLGYDPETGVLTWRVRLSQRARVGMRAGCNARDGRTVRIDGKTYREHRVIWLLVTGAWPTNEVDHENLNPLDNRWRNLRDATHKQNQENRNLRRDNTSSGVTGVAKGMNKPWQAYINHNKTRFFLGEFGDVSTAIAVRRAAESILFTHATGR